MNLKVMKNSDKKSTKYWINKRVISLKKLTDVYVRTEDFVTNFLMLSIVMFVFTAAVMRWAGSPVAWSVDIAQLLFVWLIFLGANRALRENRHIGVDFFVKKMPDKVREFIDIILYLLILGFLIFLSWHGILLSIENSIRQINSLSISYAFIAASVPIGCFIMSVTIISRTIHSISQLRLKKFGL